MAAHITSRLEWLSTLTPTNAAVPTEETKFLRKVRTTWFPYRFVDDELSKDGLDGHYRHDWWVSSSGLILDETRC